MLTSVVEAIQLAEPNETMNSTQQTRIISSGSLHLMGFTCRQDLLIAELLGCP
jgi:hypothetical protein